MNVPFTFSHPAAAVPFYRCRLLVSALVVGSISPDFEYFVRTSGQDRIGHTYPGVLLYTFPISVLMLAIFHGLVKWPLISLLPRSLQERVVEPARNFSWWPPQRLLIILVSLAVGIATHLVWDNLTHADGWMGRHWAGMTTPLGHLGGGRVTAEKVLQYGSTALGAAVLIIYFVYWYTRARKSVVGLPPRLSPAATTALLILLCAIPMAAGSIAAARKPHRAHNLPYLNHFAITFAITTAAVGAAELTAFSSVWWLVVRRTKNPM